MKKRIVVLAAAIFFLGISSEAFAQASKHEFKPGSELKLGYGAGFIFNSSFYEYHLPNQFPNYPSVGIGESMINPSTYSTEDNYIGAFSLTYTYRFKRWFELSGSLSYSAQISQCRYNLTGEKASNNNNHFIGIAPTARFVWLRRDLVTLYSGVTLGMGVNIHDGMTMDADVAGIFGLNYFGITVGKKVYGFCDLSIGNLEFISVGIGYRFNY